ncbi:pachytene checkpoint protein 2 homolog [Uranotaenia lowii]|uniref:pachytene checkpoint protein 2 homolog n=1 Tax=Uranotaenia lowii TaxID=190385 RepID=UPI00247A75E7|nr:pachytene checkpoint protein 2 homolog [Uranotaenia lowii]
MDSSNSIELEIACSKQFKSSVTQSELMQAIQLYLTENVKLAKDHVFEVKCPSVVDVMVCSELNEFTPRTDLRAYTYTLHESLEEEETLQQDGEEIQIANHWMLPAREFHGLWSSLIFEDGLKEDLLSFVYTTMMFSRKGVNSNLISCNRLVLLHGPPGTGKTSLCKALAQKLAIRMTEHYTHSHLIEINSHSLFSKWFSESGKLVQKVFGQIHELCQDRKSLVCVLVDEVESIAFARDSISNNEPSDSIRVVNAVLTQLDRIRKYPNVFVFATSNLTGSIDLAFLDRADIVQYIGNPTAGAIYEIYRSTLEDLSQVGIINDYVSLPDFLQIAPHKETIAINNLKMLAQMSVGLSGRSLRKVPFLAHALYVKQEETSLIKFISAMRSAVRKMCSDKSMLTGQEKDAAESKQSNENGDDKGETDKSTAER